MPIYEYACKECGAVTDIRHGFKESTDEACPTCGGALARRFNPAGIVFKGSGFYVTDSRKANGTSSESTPASSESKSDSAPAETKSESKSEPKSEPKSDGGTKPAKKSDTAA